jgi:hypothetical protein
MKTVIESKICYLQLCVIYGDVEIAALGLAAMDFPTAKAVLEGEIRTTLTKVQ